MSELNDFLKELANAKKQVKEQHQESEKSLGDFLSAVSEAKATDPKHQLMKEVKNRVKEDIAGLFEQLKTEPVAVEKIEELVETVELIEEVEELQEVVVPEVKPASQIHSQAEIEKYLRRDASFQQPEPDKADPNIRALQDKLKFLEQAVGRIAATGPGSGEVNFRWLDDVDRSTMTDGNNNWVLEYDSATKKVHFTNTVGPLEDINTNTASVTSLTENRIVLVGEDGQLIDDENLTFDGTDLILNGNLTVNGDLTYINTTVLKVTDKNITIADGAIDAAAADGAGITVDGANANITYKETSDSWEFNKDVIPEGNDQLDLGSSTNRYGEVHGKAVYAETVRFDTSHVHDAVREEGTLCWNSVDKTIDLTQNAVTQQIGQEAYVLVRNRTGATITNGSFVRFSGAEQNGVARLLVAPFLGDGTYANLFGLGVATEDIANGADGFVTVFGKIRGLNTTNTGITSETWQVGDILYASPTTAGKLTRVKPTAPNNVIPVAAVLRIGTTNGEIFVRPTYEQKRPYGSFADILDQSALSINTPYAVKIRRTEIANGFSIADQTKVVAAISGLYNYQFSLQLSSSNSSSKEVYIWARKNGQDIPDSATRITISGNGVYTVAAWNFVISMDANNYFELMWATSDITAKIDAPTATAFCPAVPSLLLTVTEVAL